MADTSSIRRSSCQKAQELGYIINPSLPMLQVTSVEHDVGQIVDRIFAMNAVAASAYGFDRRLAARWLSAESQEYELTKGEKVFLATGTGNRNLFRQQIEGMWALCWSVRIVAELDFARPCDDSFVRLLPDLKRMESGIDFRERSSMRDCSEIICACDLAYCLHSAFVDAQLRVSNLPNNIPPFRIIERRRALEWLLSDLPWDEVAMDT